MVVKQDRERIGCAQCGLIFEEEDYPVYHICEPTEEWNPRLAQPSDYIPPERLLEFYLSG